MWEHYREAFAKFWMPGGESDISLFWSKFQHPAMAGHALFLTENWQSKAIPISFHGDAVPDSESVEASLAAEALQRDIGWAEDKELGPNSRQRQSLDILTIAVKVEVKQEEDEHAVVPVDENAPGPFTWPELQTAPMLINSRDFLSWLNDFPQDVSHNWNMRYYFPPLQMERTSHQPMTFLVKILMNPFQFCKDP